MRIRRVIEIGDLFLTWRVKKCVNPKKYRYLCECIECHQNKEFNKYRLLNGKYKPCKCGHKAINNYNEIKTHWNYFLNNDIIEDLENIDLNKNYWFVCDNKHNFKSTIKDFSLDKCLACKTQIKSDNMKLFMVEFIKRYFSMTTIKEHDNFNLILPEFKLVIHLQEIDRYDSYRNYFKTEIDMINEISKVKLEEKTFKTTGYEYSVLKVEKKLKNSVDNFTKLMLNLTQGLNRPLSVNQKC